MNGINLVALDEVNGSVIATLNCYTYGSSSCNSQHLTNFIEQLPNGRIVVAAVSYDGASSSFLHDHAKHAIISLGSEKIHQLNTYDSWALVGYKGAPRGTAVEKISGTAPAQISARVHLKPFRKEDITISAESAGINSGKYAVIKVNDTVIDIPHVGCDRGLHVVAFNEDTGVMDTRVFDTSAGSAAYSASEQFVEMIECLKNGTIVAIAIKEEGIDHLSEKAKQACESIGSALIRQVRQGGSWAIIGRKGAAIGSVPESASSSSSDPSISTYILRPHTADDITCQIAIRSSNYYGIGSNITVNRATVYHASPSTRGHLIALLKDGECSVERNISFISPNDLLNFIKGVPPGRTVLVNLAHHYPITADYGRAALRAIGSAYVGSVTYPYTWTIIGDKGTIKGSATEQSYYEDDKALGARITLRPVRDTFWSVQSGGKNKGNYGRITNSTNSFSIPSEYAQGLLTVVLRDGFHQERTFNMTPSNSSQDIAHFVDLIDSLPAGSIVALASNDSGALNQSDEIREVIEVLGSRYISESTEGGSWAMIGRKGAPLGSVLEAASNNGPVEIITHTLPVPPEEGDSERVCSIFVDSATTGSIGEGQLVINGRHINTSVSSEDGLMLAVMKQEKCELESIDIYPTHSSNYYLDLYRIYSLIEATPPGRIVIASVYGTAHPYSPSSYYNTLHDRVELAMESIGSALFRGVKYRDAWAIIGRKGAVMGSVPEAYLHYENNQHTAVAVGGAIKLIPSCENELYELDCMSGESHKF